MVGTEGPISKPHYSSLQILSLSLPLLSSCHRGGLSIPFLGISSRLASKQHFNREETETWDVCDRGKRLKSWCGRKSTPCSLSHGGWGQRKGTSSLAVPLQNWQWQGGQILEPRPGQSSLQKCSWQWGTQKPFQGLSRPPKGAAAERKNCTNKYLDQEQGACSQTAWRWRDRGWVIAGANLGKLQPQRLHFAVVFTACSHC